MEGPVGEYLEVVDRDPASGCCYTPVDLNDPNRYDGRFAGAYGALQGRSPRQPQCDSAGKGTGDDEQ